jgi:hypothetical protein
MAVLLAKLDYQASGDRRPEGIKNLKLLIRVVA